jgi:hypothetical protein
LERVTQTPSIGCSVATWDSQLLAADDALDIGVLASVRPRPALRPQAHPVEQRAPLLVVHQRHHAPQLGDFGRERRGIDRRCRRAAEFVKPRQLGIDLLHGLFVQCLAPLQLVNGQSIGLVHGSVFIALPVQSSPALLQHRHVAGDRRPLRRAALVLGHDTLFDPFGCERPVEPVPHQRLYDAGLEEQWIYGQLASLITFGVLWRLFYRYTRPRDEAPSHMSSSAGAPDADAGMDAVYIPVSQTGMARQTSAAPIGADRGMGAAPDRAAPDIDAAEAGMDGWPQAPRVSTHLSDAETIALLAVQRRGDGKHSYSANAIHRLAKEHTARRPQA